MINSDLNRTPVEKHIAEVVIVEAVSINPVTVVKHGVKVVIVAGGSEVPTVESTLFYSSNSGRG